MGFKFVELKSFCTVVILQILEAYSYNVPNTNDTQIPNIKFQTFTIRQSDRDSTIHVVSYPTDDFDQQPKDINDSGSLDTWSIIWYIASFGGLILFFLIVSCSEWCCRRNARRNHQQRTSGQTATVTVPDTPPPSYDHFAPPSYEDLWRRGPTGEKSEYDIYVVPVHALGTIMEDVRREEAPPSYQSAAGAEQLHQVEISRGHSSNDTSSHVT